MIALGEGGRGGGGGRGLNFCIVPLEFLLRTTRFNFPGKKPAATESRYPAYGACWVF